MGCITDEADFADFSYRKNQQNSLYLVLPAFYLLRRESIFNFQFVYV
jgi:hypothetical protein